MAHIVHRLLLSLVLLAIVCPLVFGQSLNYYRLRRRCPTMFPSRQQLFHSNNIVLVGLVEQIKPLDQDDDPNEPGQQTSNYLANVYVRRVLHGQRSLQRTRIQVTGFNPPQSRSDQGNQWCYPNTRQGASWIFVLQPINYPDYFRLNSSLIKVTVGNLEKFDAIIADQPYGLRPNIAELPCEKKYCPNNAICINDPYNAEGGRCECLTHCKNSKYEPVCASNDETYNNECEMRMKSCRANKNLFVKGTNACSYFRPLHHTSYVPSRYDSSTTFTSPNYGPSSRTYSSSHSYSTRYQPSSSSSHASYSRPQYPLAPDVANSNNNRWQTSRTHHMTTITNITPQRSYAF